MKDDLIAWMERHHVRPEALAEHLRVSVKTVYNWRTSGVPKGKEALLELVMQQWKSGEELGRVILRPSEDQFRRWNRASITGPRPQTVEDWAMDALEAAAAEDLEAESGLKVAEEPPEYRTREKRSGE